jgi:S1-C subfamily serine protease
MIRAAILVALVALGQVNDGDAVVPPSADKPAPARNDDYSALIAAVEAAVIRIDVQTKDGKAIGSGFVVSDDGVAVTNFHVIEGAKSATVTFRNDAKLEVAGVLAMDKDRDIAILKIKAPGKLDFLSLAPESPKKGESVMAFGAPKGLSFSVTDGIVSAVRAGAELAESGGALTGTWIQTSAPISGGNSGGPLLDANGKELATLSGHTGPVYNAVFSPDGQRILTASEDKTARQYIVNVEDLLAVAACRVGAGLTDAEIAQFQVLTPLKFDFTHRQCPPALGR